MPGLDPGDLVEVLAQRPDQVQVTGTAQQTHLRIGDPDRAVSGRHRYRIAYRLPGVAPGGRLAWDAVGTSWPVEIGAVELHVVALFRLEGPAARRAPPAPRPAARSASPSPATWWPPSTAWTKARASPCTPPPAGVPPDPGTGPVPPTVVAAAAALLATVEFSPPRELTPAQGGVLLTETVLPEHKVAWLIGAAGDDYVDLEETDGAVTLVRLPRHHGATKYLLDVAFAGRDRPHPGQLRPELRLRLAAGRQRAGRLAGEQRPVGPGGRPPAGPGPLPGGGGGCGRAGPDRLRRRPGQPARARLAGLVAAGGLLAPAGSGPWLRTESFRRFLAASSVAAVDPAAARYPLLAPAMFSDTSRSATKPSSGGSGGGGFGGGGGGGSW